MSIIKNKLKSHYSQVSNDLITDTTISAKAYRVMTYLLSLPDGWEVNNTDVCKKLDICEDIIAKYWKELIQAGWITRHNAPRSNGRFANFEYHLNDEPILPIRNLPTLKNTVTEESRYGETTALTNTHCSINTQSTSNTHTTNTNSVESEKEKSAKKDELVTSKDIVQEVITHFNTKTNSKFRDASRVISNLKRILTKYTVDEVKVVIDWVSNSQWHIDNNLVILAYIVRPTLFDEKLARARSAIDNPIKKTAKYSDVDTFTLEDSGVLDTSTNTLENEGS